MFHPNRQLGDAPATSVDQPQYYEEPGIYVINQALLASAALNNQNQAVDGDSDFILVALAGSSTGAYQIRLKMPNGRPISNALVNNINIVGTAQFPVALPKEILYPRAGSIGYDLLETSGAPNAVQLLLIGRKRFRVL